ncbi:ATP dependent DNA ligase domain-containing protein [Colletotrichum orchidophilum]|uniref:ATP dependent DNA ligase domain-containing protein n=1 Tax=Colletotrichum orchidophilum TaxID=1209926 RepID=A0A1G4B5V3_9PEZI|nr:ATP dependent DNA ligase domain-containing protein [Colletotrichum orchidophilum]OHE96784.1 ATP dependent DNA ligase domain-containing protein [Colletotrichum orchidophilum]
MPISFVLVCDLLEQVHKQCKTDDKNLKQRVTSWFTLHRQLIDDPETDASALLSTLLPDKRTDRVYAIQADTLSNIVGRTFGLGKSRVQQLRRYKEAGRGEDLADCVARVFKETPPPICAEREAVSVEEIDSALNSLAASCRFSSPVVRASQSHPSSSSREELLGPLYLRLQAREAKWLTRIILKNFQPVMLDPGHVYYCYDPLLPTILKVQDNFAAALSLLKDLNKDPSFRCGSENQKHRHLIQHLTPVLGTKVGRPFWLKGRSIKHCMKLGHSRMSCEKKMDGEYCQVHIDMSKGFKCIQIFSKSGKDSTKDRAALHGAIRDSLKIGKPNCKLSKGCILEGELVVYNDMDKKIMPFHKIRKYVSRSGSYLHTEADSQRHDYEHLMIVYFDVLLVDEESLLGTGQNERFKRLTHLITRREGHAELVERQVINLDDRLGVHHLRQAFAKSIAAREEGLVLKPDDPYFDFSENRRSFAGCPIKLKKEYIGGFGDVGDFSVVAARYDADKAKCYGIPNLNWTHFFLGCLENKEDVQRFQAQPEFTVVHQVELNETLLKTVSSYGNPMPVSFEENDALILHLAPGIAQQKIPTVVFTEPLVFDIRCFSFDKEGNTGFWQPRFPQVSKVHFDRSFVDTISFSELQAVAEEATTTPAMEDSQEMLDWIARLEGADPRGIPVDAVSQSTTGSLMTPSRTSSVRPSTSPAPNFSMSPVKPLNRLPALLEAPETALVTPRTSSARAEGMNRIAEDTTAGEAPESPSARKRGPEGEDATQHKRPRVCSEAGSAGQGLSPPNRQPLGVISANRTPPSPQTSQSQLGAAKHIMMDRTASRPVDTALNELGQQTAGSAAEAPEPRRHSVLDSSSTQPKPQCEHAGDSCLFADTMVLLAPCIAHQPWITENLLPLHGVHNWTADPQNWTASTSDTATSSAHSSTPTSISATNCSRRKRPPRKVCFVEHNRKEATKTLMRHLQSNPMYAPSGSREYVEVYDWRLLEDVTALEKVLKGSKPSKGQPDPKRKWWVGLA